MTLADQFIEAASVPLDADHSSGDLTRAEELRNSNPSLADSNIFAAAVLGDAAAVRRFLVRNKNVATAKGGPRGWAPLTYLCFSRYLKLDATRSEGFVTAASALLNGGADANSGFYSPFHLGFTIGQIMRLIRRGKFEARIFESVLYGAAGIAHHAGVTRVLIAHGADPNDGETPYHSPETHDNSALKVLVESGRCNLESLALMLVRKADWHDLDGLRYLLQQGADPNGVDDWQPLHHAIRRNNNIANIDALLDYGADPTRIGGHLGQTANSTAARRGRNDVLASFQRRGVAPEFHGVERLIAACAMNDEGTIRDIVANQPRSVKALRAIGGTLLAEFASTGNAEGVTRLLDLGVPVAAPYTSGDGYWGIPRGSQALHVAAWLATHSVVNVLVARGAPINAPDPNGRTPLALAIRAATDSYWVRRRRPDSIATLLAAGASCEGIPLPTGYDEADALLRKYRATTVSP